MRSGNWSFVLHCEILLVFSLRLPTLVRSSERELVSVCHSLHLPCPSTRVVLSARLFTAPINNTLFVPFVLSSVSLGSRLSVTPLHKSCCRSLCLSCSSVVATRPHCLAQKALAAWPMDSRHIRLLNHIRPGCQESEFPVAHGSHDDYQVLGSRFTSIPLN